MRELFTTNKVVRAATMNDHTGQMTLRLQQVSSIFRLQKKKKKLQRQGKNQWCTREFTNYEGVHITSLCFFFFDLLTLM